MVFSVLLNGDMNFDILVETITS